MSLGSIWIERKREKQDCFFGINMSGKEGEKAGLGRGRMWSQKRSQSMP